MLAGEGDLVDAAMLDDRRASRRSIAGHDVDDTVGNAGLLASLAIRKQVSGVCSAGFITIVQPAANAGPHFQATISIGKFQGMIWPTTPPARAACR